MIRPWNRQSATRLATQVTFRAHQENFLLKKKCFTPNLTFKYIHQVLHLPRKVTLALHQVLRLPRKVTLELHEILRLPRKVTLALHQVLHLPRKVTFKLHQVLRLPRKVTLALHHASAAPALKSNSWISPSILHLPPKVTLELHQVLHLPRKVTLALHHIAPATKSDTWTSPATKSDTCTSPSTAPATKSDTWTSHQVLRLPCRKTRMLHPHHIWNVIYIEWSNRCHDATSPNIAPVTQKDSHAESSLHLKPHLQCAEQQVSPSNVTKYCACQKKWHCKISEKIFENRWNVISNKGPIREWSEHDPTTIRARSDQDPSTIRPQSEHETASPQPAWQPRLLFELTTSIIYCKIPFRAQSYIQTFTKCCTRTKSDTCTSPSILHLPPKVTLRTSPSTAPATKNTCTSPYCT